MATIGPHFLLVEDDDDKRRHIQEFLLTEVPGGTIQTARSLKSGLDALRKRDFGLVILDMTLPSFDISESEDGGRPQAYGGRELLRHMNFRAIETPAVVVTGYERFGEGADVRTLEELDRDLRRDHPAIYLGTVQYNVMNGAWKQHLGAILAALLRGETRKRSQRRQGND